MASTMDSFSSCLNVVFTRRGLGVENLPPGSPEAEDIKMVKRPRAWLFHLCINHSSSHVCMFQLTSPTTGKQVHLDSPVIGASGVSQGPGQ